MALVIIKRTIQHTSNDEKVIELLTLPIFRNLANWFSQDRKTKRNL